MKARRRTEKKMNFYLFHDVQKAEPPGPGDDVVRADGFVHIFPLYRDNHDHHQVRQKEEVKSDTGNKRRRERGSKKEKVKQKKNRSVVEKK